MTTNSDTMRSSEEPLLPLYHGQATSTKHDKDAPTNSDEEGSANLDEDTLTIQDEESLTSHDEEALSYHDEDMQANHDEEPPIPSQHPTVTKTSNDDAEAAHAFAVFIDMCIWAATVLSCILALWQYQTRSDSPSEPRGFSLRLYFFAMVICFNLKKSFDQRVNNTLELWGVPVSTGLHSTFKESFEFFTWGFVSLTVFLVITGLGQ